MNPNEIWQVEVNNKIYEAELIELSRWISQGSLLRSDKVRRGNLRWLEAGKVPMLNGFFNAKELGTEPPEFAISAVNAENPAEPLQTLTENFPAAQNVSENQSAEVNSDEYPSVNQTVNFPTPNSESATPNPDSCLIHTESHPEFVCDTCGNYFCAACPKRYGSSVRICPMCGALCKPVGETEKKARYETEFQSPESFGFDDFGRALAYPFRFKSSLMFGAVMFMFFTLGQSAASVGGIFLIASAIFCAMLANMLTFGILANTVENFSQGKLESNFMPDFDDFSLWDDVVHPFLLSIGVYISSFGPLILVFALAFYLIIGSITSTVSEIPGESVNLNPPVTKNDVKLAQQTEEVKKLLEKNQTNDANKIFTSPESLNQSAPKLDAEEEEFRKLEEMIQQNRKAQMESVVGKSPETEAAETAVMLKNLINLAAPILLLAFLAALWGAFYFPAACAVAGYTRSFTATINPLVGLDTIRHLGFDYVKILFMGFLILVLSGIIGGILSLIFSPFDMPRMGNVPAKAVGSWVTFYFSVVFSCLLGYALHKNSSKLKLYR